MKIFNYLNKHSKKYFTITVLLTSCFLLQAQPVHAAQTFSVSPVIINVPLSPGKSYRHEITLENLTTTPLPLRASLNDFEATGEEGGYTFEETTKNPLLSWIKLDQTDLILGAKEKKKIVLTITTPQAIPLGGYHGMLFFEPVITDQQSTTRIISRVGVLMLAQVGVPDPNSKQAEITTFSTATFAPSTELPLLLRVKNISLHYFTAKPILTISPVFSFSEKVMQPNYLEEKIVFQGKIRRWEQNIPISSLTPNLYRAHMAVSTGNGNFVNQDNYFIVFPQWQIIGIIVTILVLIFVLKKRKQFKKAIAGFFSS